MVPGFDEYCKHGLSSLLSDFGTATVAKKVSVAPHETDVYFEPGARVSEAPARLGLLGELLQQPTLLEPFSSRPGLERLSGCCLKLHGVWAELRLASLRRARLARENQDEHAELLREHPSAWRPQLVVFLPSASKRLSRSMGRSGKPVKVGTSKRVVSGVYYSPGLYRTCLVVCDQLPVGEHTLFIRLLFGRGETLVKAWEEFRERHAGEPVYTTLARQARSYCIYLEGLKHLKPDQAKQKKEYRMVWCLFDRDLYGEKVESLEIKIEEQARMLELVRSESATREEHLLAEQEARLRAEQEARLRAEQEARLRAEQEARLRAEQERLRAEQERLRAEQGQRAMLEEALLERFPERSGQLGPLLEHLLRLSAPLAIRTVLQQSWDALCRNASLEVVQGT